MAEEKQKKQFKKPPVRKGPKAPPRVAKGSGLTLKDLDSALQKDANMRFASFSKFSMKNFLTKDSGTVNDLIDFFDGQRLANASRDEKLFGLLDKRDDSIAKNAKVGLDSTLSILEKGLLAAFAIPALALPLISAGILFDFVSWIGKAGKWIFGKFVSVFTAPFKLAKFLLEKLFPKNFGKSIGLDKLFGRIKGIAQTFGKVISFITESVKSGVKFYTKKTISGIFKPFKIFFNGLKDLIKFSTKKTISGIFKPFKLFFGGLQNLIKGALKGLDFSDEIKGIANFFGELKNTLGGSGKQAGKILKFFKGVSDSFGVFGKVAKGLFKVGRVIGRLAGPLGVFINFGFAIWDGLKAAIGVFDKNADIFTNITNVISAFGTAFVKSFVRGFAETIDFAVDLVAGFVAKIATFFGADKLAEAALSFAESFNLTAIVDFVFDNLYKVKDIIVGLFTDFDGTISKLIEGVTGFLAPVIEKGKEFFSGIGDKISGLISGALDSVKTFFANFASKGKELVSSALGSVASSFTSNITPIATSLFDSFLEIFTNIFSGIQSLGYNLAKGLFEKIPTGFSGGTFADTDLGKSILEKIKPAEVVDPLADLPKKAEGGFLQGSSEGTPVILAENNTPELILPVDKGLEFLKQNFSPENLSSSSSIIPEQTLKIDSAMVGMGTKTESMMKTESLLERAVSALENIEKKETTVLVEGGTNTKETVMMGNKSARIMNPVERESSVSLYN